MSLMAESEERYDIPTGTYGLTPELDDEIRRTCAAPARIANEAHPIMAFIIAVGGMGRCIGDICRELSLAFDRGAVLGRCRIDYSTPIQVGVDYIVDAEVVSLVQKASRRFGKADHLTLRMTLRSALAMHAQVELTTIMPEIV